MKEIAFNAKPHEVLAILDGQKTQFRRVVIPKPTGEDLRILSEHYDAMLGDAGDYWGLTAGDQHWEKTSLRFPYGTDELRSIDGVSLLRPGTRLWVRETWSPFTYDDQKIGQDFQADGVIYRIDGTAYHKNAEKPFGEWTGGRIGWRSSTSMPRWASRITLEVVSVRVERLQDISEEDAIAEGIDPKFPPEEQHAHAASTRYMKLWETINGPCSWDANPWVWVIEFKRI